MSASAMQGSHNKLSQKIVGAKFYCPHALADGNQRTQVREKTLEFTSVVLPVPSLYHPISVPSHYGCKKYQTEKVATDLIPGTSHEQDCNKAKKPQLHD